MATGKEIERLSVVETKVDRAVSDIHDLTITVTDGFDDLGKKFDNLDKKFAAKWVQSAVGFVIAIIVGAVLTALVALVVVPNIHTNTNTNTHSTTTTTTQTTTPTGSTSTSHTTPTSSTTPSASASSTATSTPANPTSTDTSTSGGGVTVTLPKAQ